MKLGHRMTDEQKLRCSLAHIGHAVSPETRVKLSAAQRENMESEERRAKISAALMGRKASAETRERQSAALMGHPAWNKGIPTPESIRAKISRAETGCLHHNWGKFSSLSRCWRGGSRLANAKQKAKRRSLGFVPLNAPFVGCEGHHLDNQQVINMPKALHHSVWHRQSDGRGMAQMNAIAYNFLFKQEIEAALRRLTCSFV